MAYTAHVYTQFMDSGKMASVMGSDAMRVILCNGTYSVVGAGGSTPMTGIQDTAATMTAVKALTGWSEPTSALGGSNYTYNANSTTSGLALVSPTWTQSGHVWTFTTSTNPSWTTAASAFNPCLAVFFDAQGGTDATNIPIAFWDFGAAQLGTGGNYTLTINASGILTATGS